MPNRPIGLFGVLFAWKLGQQIVDIMVCAAIVMAFEHRLAVTKFQDKCRCVVMRGIERAGIENIHSALVAVLDTV